jgi:signal transduction histidine kinase
MYLKKEQGSLYYLLGNTILFIVVTINSLAIIGVINYYKELKYLAPLSYIIDIISMLISTTVKNTFEQNELKKAKILLLEQSKFSSLGQAIGHISHQWKSPLTKLGTLITLLETVLEHNIKELNITLKNKLPQIKNSIEIMKKSIDEFSNYYSNKKEVEIFSPIPCIENVLEILSSKIILKKVNIHLDIPSNLRIKSFEHIWSNIFLVLVDNSLDAFSEIDDKNKEIFISFKKYSDKVVISYIDTAGGIKIKPIESVFDYFVSEKENGKSSGFGLAVVKMLINDRLNGKINIENFKEGIKFTIII